MVDASGNACGNISDPQDTSTLTNPRPQQKVSEKGHSDDGRPSGKVHSDPLHGVTVVPSGAVPSSDPGHVRSPDPPSGSHHFRPIFPYPSHPNDTTKVHFAGSDSSSTAIDSTSGGSGTPAVDQGIHSTNHPTSIVDPNNSLVGKYPSTDALGEPKFDSKATDPRDPIHNTPISPITIYNPLTSVDKRITRLSLYAVFGFCGVCFVGLAASFIYTTCFGGATLLLVSNTAGSAIEGAGSVISSSASSVTVSADSVMELGKGTLQTAPTELTTTTTMNTGSTEALTNTSSVDVNQIDLI